MGCLIALLIFIVAMVVDFLVTSGLVWLVCFAFGLIFSWKVVIGIWAVVILLQAIFGKNVIVKG